MSSIVVVAADAAEEAARRALVRLLGPDDVLTGLAAGPAIAIATAGRRGSSREEPDRVLVSAPGGATLLALEGRLTNRQELAAALGGAEERPRSDAELFLEAYERWGDAALGRVEGTFAVAVVDTRDRSVLLARDAIGDRTLFYGMDGERLVAASEEVAVLSLAGVPGGPDHRRLAAHFGMVTPEPGSTFHRGVREVPPAHVVRFRDGRFSVSRFWEPSLPASPPPRTDQEWAELFVEHLDGAVARCLPSSGRAAVLLSGGLDSCPIAALAARRLAPARLTAVTWVFDELRACDERRFVDEVAGWLGLERISIPADDLWPLSDLATWPVDLGRPEHDPYRRLLARGYEVTRGAGLAAVLSGFGGDHLYLGAGDWFVELLAEGRARDALAGLLEAGREIGLYRAVRTLFVSPLVPRRLRRRRPPRPWLTPYARQLLAPESKPVPHGPMRRREVLLSEWTASCAAREIRLADRAGVDLRYPFRDRELVELALTLPSHQLERGRTTRPVVRKGFATLLPGSIVNRPRKTSFGPLSDRGMFGPGRPALEELLAGTDHLWAEFVDPAWVADALRRPELHESDAITIWYCAFVDLWSKRVLESQGWP